MRIKSVKRVQVPATPVYDLTVTGTQNFKLAAGPYVHNSKDLSDALAGVAFGLSNRIEIWNQFKIPLNPSMKARASKPDPMKDAL